jgi:hypothetical protein
MVDIAREALRQYQELTDIIEDSTLIGGIYNMNSALNVEVGA